MEEENKTNVEVSKKKGASPVVLVLTCLLAFAAGFAFTYFIGSDKDKDKKSNSNEVSNTNTNELTEETKKEIYKKIAILFNNKDNTFGQTIKGTFGHQYVFSNELTDNNKALLIMRNVKSETKNVNPKTLKFNNKSMNEDMQNSSEPVTFISSKEFIEYYKNVFGVEPKTDDYTGCPSYYYELNSKDYVEVYRCGYGGTFNLYVYIDNYSKGDNETVVVTSYVGSSYELDEKYYYKDSVKDYMNQAPSTTTEFKTIDNSNKDTFTKYNFIFKKASDGNYYLDSVKKA